MNEAYHRPHRLLLLFVDGVGLAPASDDNPLAAVPTPAFTGLLGSPLVAGAERVEDGLVLVGLDATLGVEGLPQSATGQTTLFTGRNAPAALGRHVTAFPGKRLQGLLHEHSVLKGAVALGVSATFANAYTPGYLERVADGARRASASTHATLASGVRFLDLDDLAAGRAVTWDMERDLFSSRLPGGLTVEPVPAATAGRHLAAVAAVHGFTLYETFYTDVAGHRRWDVTPEEAVRRLDALVGGLLEDRADDLTVVLSSDHGNLEDGTHTLHTRNPVPLLAVGPAARRFAGLERLDQVTPRILEVLAGSGPATGR